MVRQPVAHRIGVYNNSPTLMRIYIRIISYKKLNVSLFTISLATIKMIYSIYKFLEVSIENHAFIVF
jgi:hypothetical protein